MLFMKINFPNFREIKIMTQYWKVKLGKESWELGPEPFIVGRQLVSNV